MLAKTNRLRLNKEFRAVYAGGRSCADPLLVLYVRPSRSDVCRVGFSVGKKVGGSVVRNRVKRRLREAFRARLPGLGGGVDLVVVARSASASADASVLSGVLDNLIARARVPLAPTHADGPPCGDCSSV